MVHAHQSVVVTLPATAGTVTAASFAVAGSGSYTYTITLPASPITLVGTTAGVTVGTFVSNPAATGALTCRHSDSKCWRYIEYTCIHSSRYYKNNSGLQVTVNYN